MNALGRYYGRDVAGLQDEVERMFRHAFGDESRQPSTAGAWSPALDVEEESDRFLLHVELPGMTPEDVDITLEENVLTISGERRFYPDRARPAGDQDRESDGFRRVERRFGRFHRAVRLPDRVDPDKVEARYDNGLLEITVPKAEEAMPRRIEVQSS